MNGVKLPPEFEHLLKDYYATRDIMFKLAVISDEKSKTVAAEEFIKAVEEAKQQVEEEEY